MHTLLRAAFHLSRVRGSGTTRVAVLVDADLGIDSVAVAALLRPWRSWLTLTEICITSVEPGDGWLDVATSSGAGAILVISDQDGFGDELRGSARERGLRTIASGYDTSSEREEAFFQEMAHHHFEVGGLNEWDGSAVQHSRFLLQQISAANCITHFPQYTATALRERFDALGRSLEALDIGSGPISRLRWGALNALLTVTGVDPLQDIYDLILAHHGLDQLPAIRVARAIPTKAEHLDRHVTPASFDFAYCNNALDHVENPPAVVAQVARALREGSLFALEFATREGSRQEWRQLHQFDLYIDGDTNELRCQWRDGRTERLIAEGVPLTLDRVVAATDRVTTVVLRRESDTLRRGGPLLRAMRSRG